MSETLMLFHGAPGKSWNLNMLGCHSGKSHKKTFNSRKLSKLSKLSSVEYWRMWTLNFFYPKLKFSWIQISYFGLDTWKTQIPSLTWITLGKRDEFHVLVVSWALARCPVLLLRCAEGKFCQTRFCFSCFNFSGSEQTLHSSCSLHRAEKLSCFAFPRPGRAPT